MIGEGNCLCGAVGIKAKDVPQKTGTCHCSMCRKWHGGPGFSVPCGPDLEFTGQENITIFDSSSWAQRGFCKQCGTHLFYKLKQTGLHMVSTSLFDNIKDFIFDHQYYIDQKPEYYSFADETDNLTEAEVMAKFS